MAAAGWEQRCLARRWGHAGTGAGAWLSPWQEGLKVTKAGDGVEHGCNLGLMLCLNSQQAYGLGCETMELQLECIQLQGPCNQAERVSLASLYL